MASGQRETRAGGVRALVVVGEGEGVLDGVSALVGQLAKLAATMHTPTPQVVGGREAREQSIATSSRPTPARPRTPTRPP